MRVVAAIALMLSTPSVLAAQPASSVHEALLRAKPAVALVISDVGGAIGVRCAAGAPVVSVTVPPFRETGTGWFISPSGWMITSARVLAAARRPPAWLLRERRTRAIAEACGARASKAAVAEGPVEAKITVLLPNGRSLPAAIVKYSPPVADAEMSGQDLALLRLDVVDMPTLRVGNSDVLEIGERLHIVGFPAAVVDHELLNATARMEASITSGAVSGFRTDRANQPVIQTDAPAEQGNSGGPALNEGGEVVGVLTFVPMRSATPESEVQGFNFIIPSAGVVKFLGDTPVPRDEPRRFDTAWHAGVREYLRGEHRRARGYLTEADRLVPGLPDVHRLVADNERRLARQPWLPWKRIAVAMLALSGLSYAALGIRWWRRNRFRIPPAEVAQLLDSAEPPVLLDVRDAATYAASPVKIPRALHASLEGLRPDLLPDPGRTVIAYCT